MTSRGAPRSLRRVRAKKEEISPMGDAATPETTKAQIESDINAKLDQIKELASKGGLKIEEYLNSDADNDGFSISVPFGDKVLPFELEVIPAEDVKDMIYVNPETNGRPQHLLTEETLAPLVDSLKRRGQLQPIFTFKGKGGRRENIDGSRRSAGLNILGMEVKAFTCDESKLGFELTREEKVAFREEFGTALSRSPYDIGLEVKHVIDKGYCKNQLAACEYLGYKKSKVSECYKLTEIPLGIVVSFKDYNLLTRNEWFSLLDLVKAYKVSGVDEDYLIAQITEEAENFNELDSDVQVTRLAEYAKELHQQHLAQEKALEDEATQKEKEEAKKQKAEEAKARGDFTDTDSYMKGRKGTLRAAKKVIKKKGAITQTVTISKATAEFLKEFDEMMDALVEKHHGEAKE